MKPEEKPIKSSGRVVHLITGLGKGGAETMLYQIIKYRTKAAPEYIVISLGLTHYYAELLSAEGIEVINLNLKRHPFQAIKTIKATVSTEDVLCCWMYLSNLIGYLAAHKKAKKIIWCIRHSDLSRKNNSRVTMFINGICAKLSRKIDTIAYNGRSARIAHEKAGYCEEHALVLDNGCNLDEYTFNEEIRDRLRMELKIKSDARVILSVARDVPIKDIPTFIKAFALIKKTNPDAVALMCGTGVDERNERIVTQCKELGLAIGREVKLLGFRDDIWELMCASDVYVLHSAGEAFPNTLIQAMACGILCVATNVGDVKRILEEDEYIVASGDYKGIAQKVEDLQILSKEQSEVLKNKNHRIIEEKFNIKSVVKNYEKIFAI